MDSIYLGIKFPPTVNSYYSHTKRGVYISKKGREFASAIVTECKEQLCYKASLQERLTFTAILYAPDRRCRDLDNYMKALQDSLTKAEVWGDDSQVDELHVHRGVIVSGGLVRVRISEHHGFIMPNSDDIWDMVE